MAVLPIRISGDPILHQPADEVTDRDASLSALVDDMFETMDKAPGVGLAGPQVGVPLRLFVYDYPDVDGTARRGVAINPTLWVRPTPIGEPDPELEAEGCLYFRANDFLFADQNQLVCTRVTSAAKNLKFTQPGGLLEFFDANSIASTEPLRGSPQRRALSSGGRRCPRAWLGSARPKLASGRRQARTLAQRYAAETTTPRRKNLNDREKACLSACAQLVVDSRSGELPGLDSNQEPIG